MNRATRKKRSPEILQIKSNGQLFDLLDNMIKETFYLTDHELDFVIEHMKDEELDYLISNNLSFSDKKTCLNLIDEILKKIN